MMTDIRRLILPQLPKFPNLPQPPQPPKLRFACYSTQTSDFRLRPQSPKPLNFQASKPPKITSMRLPRFLRLIPVFFLVAACASLPQPVHHQNDFRQKMRIGYNHAGKGGSADLLWEQSGTDYVAVLSAGSELARMRRSGENRTLTVREDFAARVDLRHFPLAYLEYWIHISPHPAFPAEMDRNARATDYLNPTERLGNCLSEIQKRLSPSHSRPKASVPRYACHFGENIKPRGGAGRKRCRSPKRRSAL